MPPLYLKNKIYFVTFRLNDSLAQSIIREMKKKYNDVISKIDCDDVEQKKSKINEAAIVLFGKYEHQLDQKPYGDCVLAKPEVATVLYNKILSMHNVDFDLKCFSIMPNHVHILFGPLNSEMEDGIDPVDKWLKNIKGSSSRKINALLNKSGTLWSDENWDRFIRNEDHYSKVFYYIINNPYTAGIDASFNSAPYMWRKDYSPLS